MKVLLLFLMVNLSLAEDAAPPPSSKAFHDRVQKMNKLDERVKTHEDSFRKLVVQKRRAKSSEEKLAIIEQMKSVYAEYEKTMDELSEVKKELKYRFPSEGEATLRSYAHIEKKSPEELEKTVDLSTTLSNTKLAVDEKYKSFMPKKAPKPPTPTQKAEKEKEKTRLRLER